MAANKSVDRLKRFLGIDPEQYRHDDSVFHDDGSYIEEEPSVKDALLDLVPTVRGTLSYLRELFPFVNWIFHYNLTWLLGDFIAGECRNLETMVNAVHS
jgi:sodium-independent sulfate anion transporter 11